MAEVNNSNPNDKFNLEATSHEQSPINQVGQITAHTVNFGITQRTGKPFQAPPLPNHYVERPEYSQYLKTLLLKKSSDVRTLVVTAIHGLGSVGKSTLATALAYDQEVKTHFCDGILWATLGQQPNLLSLLSGWVQALGDYNFKATSVEATSIQLRTLLYDKAVLLVVDDAWNPPDAKAFNFGGACCQVLVTTRDTTIADVLGACTYSLDVMKPEQAMELLTKKLKREITGAERQSASDLTKAVGYLPLALELVAAEVASGTTWTQLLEDFQQEVARLKTLDRPEAEEITDEAILKRFSLTASLNLSVKRMPTKKQQHFSWLGVLPEDVTITKMMAATLWKMDVNDTAKTLQYLQRKALLLSGVPLGDGTPTYRLHDLFHDLACNLLTAPPNAENEGDLSGLGITLPDAHSILLEKYRNKTSKNLWHTLPDDSYIYQHLVWHLEKAEKVEEIHQLLGEESETGGNGWYEACDRLGQTANFITDVAHAWQLAEKDPWTEPALPKIVGLQCRYALIIASLNSLSANIPVELLIASIQNNVWAPEQGLAYVLQSSNPKKKANLLTELANYLPPKLEELAFLQALAAAREIQSGQDQDRARALSSLAVKLPKLFPEALAAARKIRDGWNRALVLSNLVGKLAVKLPPNLLAEALAVAREIQENNMFGSRARALIGLAEKLPELLPEALAAAREIQDKSSRAKALSSLAVKLPELLPGALADAREIHNKWGDEWDRAKALNSLADKLPPELLPEALTAAREIQDKSSRAKALSSLAVKLPELLPEALTAAREIQDKSSRAEALNSLAVKLPELLPEALAAAREIQDQRDRTKALSSLADKLPPKLLPEALAAAREIQDESSRAYALIRLVDKLPELLPEALAAVREIQFEHFRCQALSSLADKLPPDLLPELLATVREIEDGHDRAYALIRLADKLPELLPEALAATREIQSKYHRALALSSLADKLPPDLLPEALAAAREIQAAREIEAGHDRAYALSSLVDKLPELIPEALAAAREFQDESPRAYALSNLADKLPELLPEALAAARVIQNEHYRALALSSLADKLPPDLLPEALAAAREIQDESNRALALSLLADKLPPDLLPEVLAAAMEIQDESNRALALSSLADKLPPDLLPEVLAAALADAREIQDESGRRADALSSLADKLSQIQKTQLFSFWRDTLHILSIHTRPNLLSDINALTPVIFTLGGQQAVKDTADAIQDVSRWWS